MTPLVSTQSEEQVRRGVDQLVPPGMRETVLDYVLYGIPPGHFLRAVITNDLREAVGRADHDNRSRLVDYVVFFTNYTPSKCWGSVDRYNDWVAGDVGGMGDKK